MSKRKIMVNGQLKEFEEVDITKDFCSNLDWFHQAMHEYFHTSTQESIDEDCQRLQEFIVDLNIKYDKWPLSTRQTFLLLASFITRLKERSTIV